MALKGGGGENNSVLASAHAPLTPGPSPLGEGRVLKFGEVNPAGWHGYFICVRAITGRLYGSIFVFPLPVNANTCIIYSAKIDRSLSCEQDRFPLERYPRYCWQ